MVLILLFILLGFSIGVVYEEVGGRSWEQWAYIGNAFNPVVSLLAAFLVAIGLYYTVRDFKSAREEFKETTNSLEHANRIEANRDQIQDSKNYIEDLFSRIEHSLETTLNQVDISIYVHTLSYPAYLNTSFRISNALSVNKLLSFRRRDQPSSFVSLSGIIWLFPSINRETLEKEVRSKIEQYSEFFHHRLSDTNDVDLNLIRFILHVNRSEIIPIHEIIKSVNEIIDVLDDLPNGVETKGYKNIVNRRLYNMLPLSGLSNLIMYNVDDASKYLDNLNLQKVKGSTPELGTLGSLFILNHAEKGLILGEKMGTHEKLSALGGLIRDRAPNAISDKEDVFEDMS